MAGEVDMKDDRLKGKTAVVTGGRRGIGRAIALAFASAGANVALCDIDEEGMAETINELARAGSHSVAVQADVSLFAAFDERFAGNPDPGAVCQHVDCPVLNWDTVIDTNLKGTYLCCRAFGRSMIARRSGSIINLSSQVGLTPGAGTGAYSISKAGIIALTRQIALELAPYRVRANAIAPGIVKTEFNAPFWKSPEAERQSSSAVPLGRLAEPEDIAGAALFLASSDAAYVTGEVICVNGGWRPTGAV